MFRSVLSRSVRETSLSSSSLRTRVIPSWKAGFHQCAFVKKDEDDPFFQTALRSRGSFKLLRDGTGISREIEGEKPRFVAAEAAAQKKTAVDPVASLLAREPTPRQIRKAEKRAIKEQERLAERAKLKAEATAKMVRGRRGKLFVPTERQKSVPYVDISRLSSDNVRKLSSEELLAAMTVKRPGSSDLSGNAAAAAANTLAALEGKKSPVMSALEAALDGADNSNLPNRPFTLPSGAFRPKQSLGQNYLSDQNTVLRFVGAFDRQIRAIALRRMSAGGANRLPESVSGGTVINKLSTAPIDEEEAAADAREAALVGDPTNEGRLVVEIGPGAGALSRVLVERYPNMTAIEIDQRAVALLKQKLPQLHVVNEDVLKVDWRQLSQQLGGKLNIVANLPYHVVSQVLFSLADAHDVIDTAVVSMQLELAERITAKHKTHPYGIPSVIFQLYGSTGINFKIPPHVFFPPPKVDSALITIDFTRPRPALQTVHTEHLRRVVTAAFRQRRKMMRQSLKELLRIDNLTLPERWGTLRPQELAPAQFVELTRELYGARDPSLPSPPTSTWRGVLRLDEPCRAI